MSWFQSISAARRRSFRRHQARWVARNRVRAQFDWLETRALLADFVAVGSDVGVPALVRIFADTNDNNTYETLAPTGLQQPVAFSPFPGFTGGVRVAFGDFDDDGNDELVTAAGPGGGPHVIIWDLNSDGSVGAPIDSFFAFGAGFTGGLFVAAGDLGGDARDELVVSADAGGGAHIRIYSDTDGDGFLHDNVIDNLFPFGAFRGGVRVAIGDVNGLMPGASIIVAAGPGGGPHVKVYTDTDGDGAVSDQPLADSFFAYGAGFTGGVYVATGYLGAGRFGAEIITGSGPGGTATVRVFGDADLDGLVSDDPMLEQFFPYAGFAGGVRVGGVITQPSGSPPDYGVLTGPGPGGGPHIKLFNDGNDADDRVGNEAPIDQFFAFTGAYAAGVFIAAGTVRTAVASTADKDQGIPEIGTINNSIIVPASVATIREVQVSMVISHTFIGDLTVSLTNVTAGISVVLFSNIGGGNDGLMIDLVDTGITDIAAATPTGTVIVGAYHPEGTAELGVFESLDASGHWRLTVTDSASGDEGRLWDWSLTFDV